MALGVPYLGTFSRKALFKEKSIHFYVKMLLMMFWYVYRGCRFDFFYRGFSSTFSSEVASSGTNYRRIASLANLHLSFQIDLLNN